VGFRLPAAWGSNLVSRLATGAGGNLAIGAASRALSERTLAASGMDDLAEQYGGDAAAAFLDVGMGLAFGGLAHLQAPRAIGKAEAAALLTASNAHHFRNGTAPGAALDTASDAGHVRALEDAVRQVLNGENVNVAAAIPEAGLAFVPRAAEATPVAGDYDAFRHALESGGRADAASPTSSATGIDQFTAGTWRRVVAKAKPAWAEGLTDKQLLALRKDPARSAEMERVLRAENAASLEASGLPASNLNLYAAHHFGPAVAKKFARAGDDVPMEQVLSAEQMRANAYLQGKTKGEAIANWTRRAKRAGVNVDGSLVDTNPAGQALRQRLVADPDQLMRDYAAIEDSNGGTVLNTDVARELAPEYLADRTRSADVHEAASDTVKTIYETKLAQPTPEGLDRRVLFTAGGTGAGKTTGMQAMGGSLGRPEIVYDTNMNTLASAVEKVEQALAAGRDVDVLYVYRDPVEALTGGAIPRAERQAAKFGTGRTVPLDEHAKTHLGVRGVMEAIAEKYRDDPRVQITAVDNSRGKGKQEMVELASLPRVEETTLRERLEEALDQARTGGLAEDLYRGFRSPGREARPALAGNRAADGGEAPATERAPGQVRPDAGPAGESSDAYAAAADQAILDTPDLMVVDDAGNVRPAAEVMAELQATADAAAVEAQAVATAVNCALGSGT
jgi:hypothetical protein